MRIKITAQNIFAKNKKLALFLPPCCIVCNIEVGLEAPLEKKYNITQIATAITDKSIKE